MPTVLIVESDDDLREVLTEGLQLAGWSTVPARNGREAVDLARRCALDVVLADTMLSDHDGPSLELAFAHSPELHAIPFVFMTAFPPRSPALAPAGPFSNRSRSRRPAACWRLSSVLSRGPRPTPLLTSVPARPHPDLSKHVPSGESPASHGIQEVSLSLGATRVFTRGCAPKEASHGCEISSLGKCIGWRLAVHLSVPLASHGVAVHEHLAHGCHRRRCRAHFSRGARGFASSTRLSVRG